MVGSGSGSGLMSQHPSLEITPTRTARARFPLLLILAIDSRAALGFFSFFNTTLSTTKTTMAKAAKAKKQDISKHSRAARRAEEPVDKSLVSDASTIKPTRPKVTASVLASQNAGISKKQKQKHMTHQQRVRQERALEKADANMDKHERKVEKSKKRGRTVEERRKDWETLNGDKKQPNPFAALGNINTDDVDMEASSDPRESLAAINAATIAAVAQRPQSQRNAPAQDESDLEVE
ncbi:Alb1-domain-containing protein [Phyllosticta citrichinensis]|uniref:Alb1-domain-containing protein n=1 Tax=Phyllosticta citrichinensis TaxID=1130410 RepID=A0ABR1XK71_9PEZI